MQVLHMYMLQDIWVWIVECFQIGNLAHDEEETWKNKNINLNSSWATVTQRKSDRK
jgi:hypothetical protein